MASYQSLGIQHDHVASLGTSRAAGILAVSLIIFLTTANVLDPGGVLGIKYVSFGVAACFALAWIWHVDVTVSEWLAGFVLFLVWPLASLLHGVLRGVDVRTAVSQVTPFVAVFVVGPLAARTSMRLPLRAFYWCLFSLALITIALFGLQFFYPQNAISSPVVDYLAGYGRSFGFFGTKPDWQEKVPNIYFGATLFFVPTFVYFLALDRILLATIVLVALGVTFSKAGVLFCVGFALIWSLVGLFRPDALFVGRGGSLRRRGRVRRRILAGVSLALTFGVVSVLVWQFQDFTYDVESALYGQSDTASVRISDARDFLATMSQNPQYLLWGQGAGVYVENIGGVSEIHPPELDHLNAIRKFGLPWFAAFTWIVFYVAWMLWRIPDPELRAFGLAVPSIFLVGGTNPVLTSPLFMMLLPMSYLAQRKARRCKGELTFC